MSLQLPDDTVALLWGELQTEIDNSDKYDCSSEDFEAAVENIGTINTCNTTTSIGAERRNSMPTLFEGQELKMTDNSSGCPTSTGVNALNSAQQSLLGAADIDIDREASTPTPPVLRLFEGQQHSQSIGGSMSTLDHRRYLSPENVPSVEKGDNVLAGGSNSQFSLDGGLNTGSSSMASVGNNLQRYAHDVSKRFSTGSIGLKQSNLGLNGNIDASTTSPGFDHLFEPTPVLDPDPCSGRFNSHSQFGSATTQSELSDLLVGSTSSTQEFNIDRDQYQKRLLSINATSQLLHKASSAPILGRSNTSSMNQGMNGSSGNSSWDLNQHTSASLHQRSNVVSNSSFASLSAPSSKLSRVKSDSNAIWAAADIRQQNRGNQRRNKFLTLNRPRVSTAQQHIKQQKQQQQIGSLPSIKSATVAAPSPDPYQNSFDDSIVERRKRCDYIDFSMIDDSKISDDKNIYGQTYESVLRNPTLSEVKRADIRVLAPVKNLRDIPTFPKKLMNMLSRSDVTDAITWLPHGRSFIVRNPKLFEEEIYPRFFKPAKYKSFQRQLNLWKFLRINKGFDSGSYYHHLFLRGKPTLVKKMTLPTKSDETDRRSSNPDEVEPDFYALAKVRPLPELPPSNTPLPPKYGSVLTGANYSAGARY
mmetsp:Transcript_9502/g.14128  ORF Transcript_9502/g.14128 Transcript_9502/m.14128 type:complete len:645 (-) Transcript_9502:196-2130(-)|eukprot:CAMPEP_0196824124 /NCGR_PEP_ID=MMETSP1362-20130617/90541_1 /TAXON_ID=163516 /ORGANISM="Leptocylindrus danicus, Strain CCMP1856" /LENGTH=644 /DNA_ID=CAMNT_0042204275 /DNA_START=137 /DNA_END=2071 /DNA_ORIENTATION=+